MQTKVARTPFLPRPIPPVAGAVLAGALLLSLGLLLSIWIVRERALRTMAESSAHVTEDVEDRLIRINSALEGLHAFFRASEKVEPNEFEIFCMEIKRNHPFVETATWVAAESRGRKTMTCPAGTGNPNNLIEQQSEIAKNDRSAHRTQFFVSGNRGVFFLPASSGGTLFLTVQLQSLLPTIDLEAPLRSTALFLSNAQPSSSSKPIVRHNEINTRPPLSFDVEKVHAFRLFEQRWTYKMVFAYRPGFEDWLLAVIALIFAAVGGAAVLLYLRILADRAFRLEQIMRAQSMKMLGTVAGGIVHDFNNVLVGIVGTISIVKDLMSSTPTVQTADLERPIGIMERAADRGSKIVARLVGLAKPGRDPHEAVALATILKETTELAQGAVGRSVTIHIQFDRSAETAAVMGSATQLTQAFLNLAVNGAHAMTLMRNEEDTKGGTLNFAVNSFYPDRRFTRRHSYSAGGKSYWKVSVSDTGVGMDDKTMARIFTPFFSTKSREQGTGLGLASVYLIVKAHAGYIEVSSTPGKGTTFDVFLPALHLP